MRYRLVWVKCSDCGRSSEMPGYCMTVEQFVDWKLFKLHSPFLVEYDRCGDKQARHFKSKLAAIRAFNEAMAEPQPDRIVSSELI